MSRDQDTHRVEEPIEIHTLDELLTRRGFTRVVGGALGSLGVAELLAACGGGSSKATTSSTSKTLNIGLPVEPSTVDPQFINNSTDQEVAKNLYASWLQYATEQGPAGLQANTGDVVGNAIESYSVSSDGKTYVFKVRPGVKFPQSGNPLTVEDFLYGIKRALTLNNPGAVPYNTTGITLHNVTKNSDHQFTATLAQPTSVALPSLRDNGIGVQDSVELLKHTTASDPFAKQWAARNYCGCGPYVLKTWETGVRLVFTANPAYWAKPHFTTVNLQIVPHAADRVLFLQNGTLDIAEGLDTTSLKEVSHSSSVRVVTGPSLLQYYFGLTYKHAPFNDPSVRTALAHAIDYKTLASDVLGGYAKPPKGFWPQYARWFEAPWSITYDPAKAKQLLSNAGQSSLRFTCQISDIDTDSQSLAVAVQTNLAAVGVTMNIEKVPQAVFQSNLAAFKPTAFLLKNGPFVDDPYYYGVVFYNTGAVLNYTGYSNKQVDGLGAALKVELNQSKRKAMTHQMQTILNDTLPYIPIADTSFVLPVRGSLAGIVAEPDTVIPYRHLQS